MKKPKILFFGYGSEYSLRPLFEFMTKKSDNCIEIDMLTEENVIEKLKALEGESLIFVTSAHPLYDHRNFFYYRTERRVFSALHVISTLKPVVSVYYPHDYKDPLKNEELHYLPLFDLLLWPFREALPSALIKTEPVGWIKNVETAPTESKSDGTGKAVFFLGAFQYYLDRGFETFYDDFADLFEAGISVKLPRWHGSGAFESFLVERGVAVHPSDAVSIEVMKAHDIIITHALSSVGVEACHLGKKVVYIKDPRFDYADPMVELQSAGSIAFIDSPSTLKHLDSGSLIRNSYSMQPFDFAHARQVILSEYAQRCDA